MPDDKCENAVDRKHDQEHICDDFYFLRAKFLAKILKSRLEEIKE